MHKNNIHSYRATNFSKLHGYRKIEDMSRASNNSLLGNATMALIQTFFDDNAAASVAWHYNSDYSITVEGDCVLDMKGIDELPSFMNFYEVTGDFILNNIDCLKNTYGFPQKILGDFTLSSARLKKQLDTQNLPDYVGGNTHFHNCEISANDLGVHNGFVKDSADYDEPEGLTDEQQQILDFAADLLSTDEWNDLQEFFYNQY